MGDLVSSGLVTMVPDQLAVLLAPFSAAERILLTCNGSLQRTVRLVLMRRALLGSHARSAARLCQVSVVVVSNAVDGDSGVIRRTVHLRENLEVVGRSMSTAVYCGVHSPAAVRRRSALPRAMCKCLTNSGAPRWRRDRSGSASCLRRFVRRSRWSTVAATPTDICGAATS
jgi:hypothetical protein